MNNPPFLCHLLEFCTTFFLLFYAMLPLRNDFVLPRKVIFPVIGTVSIALVVAGAALCTAQGWRTTPVMFAGGVLIYGAIVFLSERSMLQTLFVELNAIMLGLFCDVYAASLLSSVEYNNHAETFTWITDVLILFLCLVIAVLYFRLLKDKIPAIFRAINSRSFWIALDAVEVVVIVVLYISVPREFNWVMNTNVRVAMMFLPLFVPLIMFVFLNYFYRVLELVNARARIQQRTMLLEMESRRYDALRVYLQNTRTIRHDFRHNIQVITRLAEEGKTEELKSYLKPLSDTMEKNEMVRYSANVAVDAVAAHYQSMADQQETRVSWQLELPEKLPIEEIELCSILGNLVENALIAVRELPPASRSVHVIGQMLSDKMLGLTVENPFAGEVLVDESGLPTSEAPDHGIGLASVRDTVKRYHGEMDVRTTNNIFSVDILMYAKNGS